MVCNKRLTNRLKRKPLNGLADLEVPLGVRDAILSQAQTINSPPLMNKKQKRNHYVELSEAELRLTIFLELKDNRQFASSFSDDETFKLVDEIVAKIKKEKRIDEVVHSLPSYGAGVHTINKKQILVQNDSTIEN